MHPPYPLDGFCLQRCGSVTYGTTALDRYYPSTAPFPSLIIYAMQTPVKTTPELSRPAFRVLPKTGDKDLAD